MEILNILKSSLEQEIAEKEFLLQTMINTPSVTMIEVCKELLKEIGANKLALSTLYSMMPEKNEQ